MTHQNDPQFPPARGLVSGSPDFPEGTLRRGQTVLFLQGLATPFYATLAEKLAARGMQVHRLHFCGGDWHFRGAPVDGVTHHRFTDKPDQLADFYRRFITDHGVDTIIVFGDCRPIHEPAAAIAREQKLAFYAFDEGYIRPGYITMEAEGTNGHSRMPKTPDEIKRLAALCPAAQPYTPIQTDMSRRVKMDLAHHAANIRERSRYPYFRSHRPAPVWKEAQGWITRGWNAVMYGKDNDRTIDRFINPPRPFFLVPLQLNSDYQIRRHSRFTGGMPEFIREVLTSFAGSAPAGTDLFVKNHPLDNGMINYRRLIKAEARNLGISERVFFAAGGDLVHFLEKAEGVVLCNSTVGFAGLKAGAAMKVLGTAIYDMDGLTDQQRLDQFWQKPKRPQQSLAQDFLTVVETYTQVKGDLFSEAGIERASTEAAAVIAGEMPRLPAGPLSDKP